MKCDTDYALHTNLYQLTMAAAYFESELDAADVREALANPREAPVDIGYGPASFRKARGRSGWVHIWRAQTEFLKRGRPR